LSREQAEERAFADLRETNQSQLHFLYLYPLIPPFPFSRYPPFWGGDDKERGTEFIPYVPCGKLSPARQILFR
jgi:hypothetical protein